MQLKEFVEETFNNIEQEKYSNRMFDLFGGDADDYISDLNNIKEALNSVYNRMATHGAESVIEELSYEIGRKITRAKMTVRKAQSDMKKYGYMRD